MVSLKEGPVPFCISGYLAFAVFSLCWLGAVIADPSWQFGVHSLSEMGVSDVPATAALFAAACIGAGILGMVFSVAKARYETGMNRISGKLLFVALAFLVCVGIFNKEWMGGNVHNLVATTFFLLTLVAVILSAVGDRREGNRPYLAVTLVLLAVIAVFVAFTGFPMFEAVGVICIMLWVISQSTKLLTVSLN